MPREEDPNLRLAGRFENLADFVGDLLAVLDLLHDPDLHVVHDQRQTRRITNIFKRLRNSQSEHLLHYEFLAVKPYFSLDEGAARVAESQSTGEIYLLLVKLSRGAPSSVI